MKLIINTIATTIFVFVSIVLWVTPSFAQNAKLTVPDSLIGKRTLYLKSQSQAPLTGYEGQLYYNTDGKIYYSDGSQWKELAGGDKITVATRIVAAYNSLGSTQDGTPTGPSCLGDGTACSNPKADYTCNGRDDHVMIQNAINDLTVGGAVYLLEGTYSISNSITLNNSDKAIIGTGKATELKAQNAISTGIISASNVKGIRISQIMINGDSRVSDGIFLNTVDDSKIDKVWVENLASSGSNFGINISNSSKNFVLNNYVSSRGIGLTSSNNNILSDNIIRGDSTCGISLSASNKNSVSKNQIAAVANQGIDITGSSSNNIISSNNIQGYTNYGIRINGGQYNNISSNSINPYNSSSTTIGINIAQTSKYNTISTNVLGGNYKEHILVDSSSNNSFLGNLLWEVIDSQYSGIRATGDSDNNLFSSNRIYDGASNSPAAGIFLHDSNTADTIYLNNNSIVANLIDGYPSDARIVDMGLTTKYLQKEKINLEYKQMTSNDSCIYFDGNPISFLALNPSISYALNSTKAIDDGKAVGDMLILMGASASNKIRIPNNANTRLGGSSTVSGRRTLG